MTPLQVRRKAQSAARVGDKALALEVCKAILDGDLFIGFPPEKTSFTKELFNGYAQRCQGCGTTVPKGTKVVWTKGVGIYHTKCYTPTGSSPKADGGTHDTQTSATAEIQGAT